MSKDTLSMAREAARILSDKKAEDIQVLDLSKLTVITDYFVIASGNSDRQVKALYEELEEKMEERGYTPLYKEGHRGSRWIVLDFNGVIVHLFYKETREFYSLERLWADAERIPLPAG